MAVTSDVKLAAGNLQVCVGYQAGDEATIHVRKEIFKDKDVDAAILADPTNVLTPLIEKQRCTILQLNAQK